MSVELVMSSNHLILCCPLLILPLIFPSIRVFFNEATLHIRWPKYWSFSFSTSPSNEYSGLISYRMDWLDLLAVQEALKSLLQLELSSFLNPGTWMGLQEIVHSCNRVSEGFPCFVLFCFFLLLESANAGFQIIQLRE